MVQFVKNVFYIYMIVNRIKGQVSKLVKGMKRYRLKLLYALRGYISMRKNKIVSIVVIILLLPYVLSVFIKGEGAIWMIRNLENDTVCLERKGQEKEIDWEEYLIGILAKEIPVEYSDAAIEAQSIIIQTRLCQENGCKNVEELLNKEIIFQDEYYTIEEIERKWNSQNTVEIYRRLKNATEHTAGNILMYEGEIAKTPYHILSNGNTRIGSEVFPDENLPYLVSVSCPLDLGNEKELTMSVISYEELVKQLEIDLSEEKENSGQKEVTYDQIEIIKKDKANYVLEVQILDQVVTGEYFRTKLHLKSSCFSFQEDEEGLKITTEGMGHGMGMSQNTAHYMGLEGKNYEEILQYFFPGTALNTEEDVEEDAEQI